jgi:nucleotide-binding universal stress UspA family protein
MKFQRILFPTDFSELSRTAENCACELAKQFGAELHVLHVLQDFFLSVPQTAAALLIPPQVLQDVVNSAEAEIQKVPSPARAGELKVVRVVRIGSTYDAIVAYAQESNIDLIVIGTHGRTGLRHMLLGSVAERVVQHAKCAVLTVPSKILSTNTQSAE